MNNHKVKKFPVYVPRPGNAHDGTHRDPKTGKFIPMPKKGVGKK
jgi:hypothetical protein